MKYATKTAARDELEKNKSVTGYFDGSLNMADMKEMFRYRMGFGEAETNTIMAALVLAGAKFKI